MLTQCALHTALLQLILPQGTYVEVDSRNMSSLCTLAVHCPTGEHNRWTFIYRNEKNKEILHITEESVVSCQ